MPDLPHFLIMSSGHVLTWISPMCAFLKKYMHKRDCPMPPPNVCESLPFKSNEWKFSSARSGQPLSSSCAFNDSGLTRMPIDESSIEFFSIGFQTKMSPFKPL